MTDGLISLHEFSMATSLVETILERVQKNDVERVLEVELVIGKLTLLEVDQVTFCYNVITKGTMMQGSKLLVTENDIKVSCANCGYAGTMKFENDLLYHMLVPTLQCPSCSSKVRIVEGNECIIKKVKYQKKKQPSS
jgi:hydrogenase nickel incorporation protein HypA/HybF